MVSNKRASITIDKTCLSHPAHFVEHSCKRGVLDAQHSIALAAGSMDVLEVLGSSDVILPMLATTMTAPTRSALGSAAQTDPLQPTLEQQQTCQNNIPAQPAKASHSAAVREEDQAQPQSAESAAAAAAAPVKPQADRMTHSRDQLQHSSIDASGVRQNHEGPDESCRRLQTVPSAQTTAQSQNRDEARPSQTASAKPVEGSQARMPSWLQPAAPLPDAEQMPLPSQRLANTRYMQQQQWQEQWQDQGHTMQAGLALTTMRPPRIAEAHLQQGFGQIVAPLDQQELTQKLPPHSNEELEDSESRPSITGVVAPVHVQHDGEEAGKSSAASLMHTSQRGAPQQSIDDQDNECHAQQAAASIPELDEMHDQTESRLSLPAASSTEQGGGVALLEHSQQAQQARRAQHPRQAQHAQQTQHALGQEPLHHPSSEAAHAHTCQQSNQTQQATDQSQCGAAVQDQHSQNSWQGSGHAVAGHSGIVPGKPVVSSREHAQQHLLNAAPLPWQQPETQGVAALSEKHK